MFKVDEKTLRDAHDSITLLALLLAASYKGRKLKASEVDKAIIDGMASANRLDDILPPKS